MTGPSPAGSDHLRDSVGGAPEHSGVHVVAEALGQDVVGELLNSPQTGGPAHFRSTSVISEQFH